MRKLFWDWQELYRHFKPTWRNCSLLPVGFCTEFVVHTTRKDNYTPVIIKRRCTTLEGGHSIQSVQVFNLLISHFRINCPFGKKPKRANKIFGWKPERIRPQCFKATSQLRIAVSEKRTYIFTLSCAYSSELLIMIYRKQLLILHPREHLFQLTGSVAILLYLYNTKYVYFV